MRMYSTHNPAQVLVPAEGRFHGVGSASSEKASSSTVWFWFQQLDTPPIRYSLKSVVSKYVSG